PRDRGADERGTAWARHNCGSSARRIHPGRAGLLPYAVRERRLRLPRRGSAAWPKPRCSLPHSNRGSTGRCQAKIRRTTPSGEHLSGGADRHATAAFAVLAQQRTANRYHLPLAAVTLVGFGTAGMAFGSVSTASAGI